jgi:hypothetical protein
MFPAPTPRETLILASLPCKQSIISYIKEVLTYLSFYIFKFFTPIYCYLIFQGWSSKGIFPIQSYPPTSPPNTYSKYIYYTQL